MRGRHETGKPCHGHARRTNEGYPSSRNHYRVDLVDYIERSLEPLNGLVEEGVLQ